MLKSITFNYFLTPTPRPNPGSATALPTVKTPKIATNINQLICAMASRPIPQGRL